MTGPSAATRLAPWLGLVVSVVLLCMAFGAAQLFGWDFASRAPRSASTDEVPPLHGLWEPKLFGPGTLPAIAVALLGWRYAADLAERLP